MATLSGLHNQIQSMDTIQMKLPQSMSFQGSNLGSSSLSQNKRQKFKLEPLKVLEPSNKKLNLPESQRIMYILEELIKKIEIVDYITLISNDNDKLREIIRSHLSEDEKKKNFEQVFISMCQHHKALVDSYDKGQFKSNETVSSQNKQSLELLIKSSCKDILRVFYAKPALLESFKDEFSKTKQSKPQVVELKSIILRK